MGGVIFIIIAYFLPAINEIKTYIYVVINDGNKILSNTILWMQSDELLSYLIVSTASMYIVSHGYWTVHLLVTSIILQL